MAQGRAEAEEEITDTIVAVATPPGEGAIGIVRLSGAGAVAVASRFLRTKMPLEQVPARQAVRATAYSPSPSPLPGERGEGVIDEVVVTVWRAPASYTGEDLVEVSAHGSPYILESLVRRALECGARAARPGEFTFRAYRNGKLDLAQAEAVSALIRARTADAHRAAAHQLGGGLSERVSALRAETLDLTARLEARLDHAEEVPALPRAEADAAFAALAGGLERLAGDLERGRLAREGARVAIVGPPNAGKSSLLNALLGRERAIVLEQPGTTRDTLEETADLGGLAAVLIDTAGLREHALDPAERQGMARTRQALQRADAVLCVVDGSRECTRDEARTLEEIARLSRASGSLGEVLAMNKADIYPHPHPLLFKERGPAFSEVVAVSAKTGQGLEELVGSLRRVVGVPERGGDGETLPAATERHRDVLRRARQAAAGARSAAAAGDEEVAAAGLREAAACLQELTGGSVGDEVLERVFANFCVGK